MSDQDKLEEYIRDNTVKEKKKKSAPPPTPKKVQTKTALKWYTRKISGDIVGFLVIISVVSYLVFLYLDSNLAWEQDRATFVASTVWASLMAINVCWNIYRVNRYKSWINGEYYKLKGWHEFFSKRSELYWSARRYTLVKIIIKLAPDATDLHVNAAKAFAKKTVEKWDKRYEGIDWEPGYGKPKDLVANGTTMQGDISLAEVMMLVKILLPRFLPLSKLLGNKLSEVIIESNDKEELIKVKKESRMDRKID